MPYTDFVRAQRVLANFIGANLTMSDFRHANLREAQFNKAVLEMVNFSGANLHLADLNGTSITAEQLKSALSIRDARLPNGSLGRDPNLIINGHADCNRSLNQDWVVESGIIDIKKFSSENTDCVFALQSDATEAMMRQEMNLSSVWESDLWPYSRVLLSVRMNGSVSVELNGYDTIGQMVAQIQTSMLSIISPSLKICSFLSLDMTEMNIPMRLTREMHYLEVRTGFRAVSKLSLNATSWCDDIELFIEYGTEFESRRGM